MSFTFDDVPRSAVDCGARILQDKEVAGTFYLSGSLAGQENLELGQYVPGDIKTLLDAGHEIGCHTHQHENLRDVPPSVIQDDLDKNFDYLRTYIDDRALTSFSYPFGSATVASKNIIRKRFSTARGIKPGINSGITDLSQLRANALYENKQTEDAIASLVRSVIENKGWLVFYTHDVSETPTKYGCTPELLEFALNQALNDGADVLCVRSALATKAFM